jgi:AcrR family transcriptional regulator
MASERDPGRRADGTERRGELVEAAIRLIAREGVAAASTRRVSEEAGIPPGTFHYWFADKEELLECVIRTILDDLESARSDSASGGGGLADGWKAAFEIVRSDNPGRQLAMYELTTVALRTPELRSLAREQYAAYRQAGLASVADWLRDRETSFRPGVLGALVAAVFDGLTLAWLADPEGTPVDEVLELLAALLEASGDR